MGIHRCQKVLQRRDVLGGSCERQADEIDFIASGPQGILDILGTHRGDGQRYARKVDSLPGSDRPSHGYDASQTIFGLVDHIERDGAVGKHDPIAYVDLIDEFRIVARQLVGLAGILAADEREFLPNLDFQGVLDQLPESDFWTC